MRYKEVDRPSIEFFMSKRFVNETLLEFVRSLPCTVCHASPSDPHHVKTRGAGGQDHLDNLMPLCRKHHVEWHQGGPSKMFRKYPQLHNWVVNENRKDVLSRYVEFN
jgi:hypothetical protein